MDYWIISANPEMYDHASSFEHFGEIDWRQKANFKEKDIVYIYCSKPIQRIRYKCLVEKVNLKFNEIRDDKSYWLKEEEYINSLSGNFVNLKLLEQVDTPFLNLNKLLENGLKRAPQGPMKVTGNLLDYLKNHFIEEKQSEIFPETLDSQILLKEGIKVSIVVNKYERSSVARAKCIEYHGVKCSVCEIDFKSIYGEIGDGFIHVHHITPISEIKEEYKVDYKKDLIPVCPNCHAMLHRKLNGKELKVHELRDKMEQIKNEK